MTGRRVAVLAGAALTLFLGSEAHAQDAENRRGSRMTASPERIMSMRERLELTEDQLQALEQLRAEDVDQRAQQRAQMDEMRSRLRAGEIEREEMRAFMEELRDGQSNAGDRSARVEGILTEDQLRSLQEMRTRGAGVRGSRGAVRGGRAQMRGPGAQVRGPRAGVRGARSDMRAARGQFRARDGAVRGGRAQIRMQLRDMRMRRGGIR